MADIATYNGVDPITVRNTSVALARGVRVTLDSSGTVAVSDAATRGDYVTLQAIGASSDGVASPASHSKVPALASEAVAVGDPAYSAASGKFSKTSTNAVYMGRWVMAASGDGVLGEVQLESAE